ncbi:hypothetical protein ACFWY9_16530 [Amycolatopsis sp. NPDC059027]|uniref:hypothetical protein n=1 Tax=Amycolatopsis sp. NPDC059027 TaxID=3346709 RepID=UPI00367041FD
MSWADERAARRRADWVAQQEQARLNTEAAAEQARKDKHAADTRREQRRNTRRAAREAAWGAVGRWLSAHRVDLPIYLLALASAVMAVPAMARFGLVLYGNASGVVLPILSELGMWAFALAVQVTRAHHPGRPVWALQAGVGVFAGYGFALNLLDGLGRGWTAGVVMGLVSVAGVIAHQLAVAAPPRSRAERTVARLERAEARKTARVRRTAVRHAVAQIREDGTAALVYTPGLFVLTRPRVWRRARLVGAIVPGRPVTPADTIADEAAAWLAGQTSTGARGDGGGVGTIDQPRPGAVDPVDPVSPSTPDRGPDLRESTPDRGKRKRTIRAPKQRSMDQLRAEFAEALADPNVAMDPTSAESIRKTLRCGIDRARILREDYEADRK